ncbi:MAG: 8-oxo-dGTP diphosphatase [Candidatus Pacebacteria bacterium]|nr:8-oxo-dGTP diphosphatase [Candidatus Paceibacterota bacterium]
MAATRKILTLCMVRQGSRVLLGMKKRGFGAGRLNGFGGKVEAGETIEAAAKRELREEAGIEALILQKVGLLAFTFANNPEETLEVHVFTTREFSGDPVETEEMKPQWFDESEIPYALMWPDDIFWIPLLLEGKKFTGSFLFGPEDTILHQDLHEIEAL